MTLTESVLRETRVPHVLAPRFSNGVRLGMYEATVRKPLPLPGSDQRAYVVRFEDGHEAGVLRSEFLATCHNWSLIDGMDEVGF